MVCVGLNDDIIRSHTTSRVILSSSLISLTLVSILVHKRERVLRTMEMHFLTGRRLQSALSIHESLTNRSRSGPVL